MAITTAASGTQAATVGTEHTLFDSASAGTYLLDVDAAAMVAGDLLEVRAYKMVLAGGTRRGFCVHRRVGAQPADDTIAVSIPITTPLSDAGAVRFTLTQVRGTSRSFPWSVTKVA